MYKFNVPVLPGQKVYKICPKCNPDHKENCNHCAWQYCITSGCDVGVGVSPDGSFNSHKLQVCEVKCGELNYFTILRWWNVMYFGTKEDAEKAISEYNVIRNIPNNADRYDAYRRWRESRFNERQISVNPPKAHWILKAENGTGVCSHCNHQDHIDPLAKYCRYCGSEIENTKEESR